MSKKQQKRGDKTLKNKILKVFCFALILSTLSFVITACNIEESPEPKAIVNSGSDDTATDNEASKSKEKESNIKENATSSTTIEEQVLLDQDGLKITATELVEDSIWGKGVKLLIENESDKNLGVGCNALIVNNYMITDLFSTTIASGKKANEVMYFASAELEEAGINNIGQIEIHFNIFNDETYETIVAPDCVTIKTSDYDNMDVKAMDEGKELLNQDGVKIVGRYVDENSIWGTGILLYIENTTGKNIVVQCDNMSINGFMVSPFFSCNVYDGKMALTDITIMETDLQDNNIEAVKDVELQFNVFDDKSYEPIFETNTIKFSVE